MNNFLSPTYWGSLIALLATLLILAWSSAVNTPPQYVRDLAAESSVANAIFYCSILVVAVCTIRYYMAITLNIYGAGQAYERLRPKIKKLVFALLCSLYFLSTWSVGALSVIGVELAMWACLIMAAVSGLCVVVCWTLAEERQNKYSPTRLSFGGFDVIFFGASLIYVWLISNGPNEKSAQWLSVVAFFITCIAFHELVGIYRHQFRQLFDEVEEFLRS